MKKTSVVIIGAGIAGITLAIYLKRANIDFVLLEGKSLGGKLNMIHKIENYPGFLSVSGTELISNFKNQLDYLDIEVTHGEVQIILSNENGYEVKTDVDSYISKVVVVATGIDAPKPGIKGEKEYLGKGVSYCATCDGNFFKGMDVAVIGNNDVALEEALYLANIVNKVYFVTSEDKLSGEPSLISSLMNNPKVEVMLDVTIDEIKGDEYGVTSIVTSKGEKEVFGVFPYIGSKSSKEFLNNLHVSLDGNFIKVDEGFMSVSNKGLFAIGDIVPKKVRQLVTASGDAATASNYIIAYLKDNKE